MKFLALIPAVSSIPCDWPSITSANFDDPTVYCTPLSVADADAACPDAAAATTVKGCLEIALDTLVAGEFRCLDATDPATDLTDFCATALDDDFPTWCAGAGGGDPICTDYLGPWTDSLATNFNYPTLGPDICSTSS